MGFDPVSMAVIGGLGVATQAFGSLESGRATAQADSYRAQVAANNAALARQQGTLDIQAGEIQAQEHGLKTRATVGQEKAAQGAAGIDINSGSAADVRAGTAATGIVDMSAIRSNAAKKAYADEVQANSDTAQGQLDTMAGEQAETGAEIGAAGTLLSGASTVGGNYLKFQNAYGKT